MATLTATGFKGGLCSSFHGSWGTSLLGEDQAMLANSVPTWVRVGKPVRSAPMMKNVNEGKGLFAPLVVIARNIIGKKRFNQLRGKAIALHSQVHLTSLYCHSTTILLTRRKLKVLVYHPQCLASSPCADGVKS